MTEVDLNEWAQDNAQRCLAQLLLTIDRNAQVLDRGDEHRPRITRFVVIDGDGEDYLGDGMSTVESAITDAVSKWIRRSTRLREESDRVLLDLGNALDGLHKWRNPETGE